MLGLIWKDLINLKKNAKIFAILAVLYAFMAYFSADASFFSSMFTMLIAILTLSVYSYDELARWDIYALTMPVSREDIVRGKYIIMLLLTLIGSVIGTLSTIAIQMIQKGTSEISGLENAWFGGAIVILFYSIALPFITKLGVEKARLIFFVIYLVPFGIIYFVERAVEAGSLVIPAPLIRIAKQLMDNIAVLTPIVLIIALFISYSVSLWVYRQKEF